MILKNLSQVAAKDSYFSLLDKSFTNRKVQIEYWLRDYRSRQNLKQAKKKKKKEKHFNGETQALISKSAQDLGREGLMKNGTNLRPSFGRHGCGDSTKLQFRWSKYAFASRVMDRR